MFIKIFENYFICKTFIITLLFCNTAFGDSLITGHMIPFDSEMLQNPIRLDCGAVIKEWRGSSINRYSVNKICTITKNNFFLFIKEKNKYDLLDIPFSYDIAIIPADSSYRSLNDRKFRFVNRSGGVSNISGYTSHNNRYLFNVPTTDSDFEVSLTHELFHALSHHYGVVYQHPGYNLHSQIAYDEEMAQEFTMKFLHKK